MRGPSGPADKEPDLATATTTERGASGLRAVTAARAIVAAALAVVVTFTADHTPSFGLLVFGAFGVVYGLVVVAGARTIARTRSGRGIVVARGLVLVLAGALALVRHDGGLGTLLVLEAPAFLVAGALEVLGGLRRVDANAASRDAVVVGGLALLVGAMLSILTPDSIFAVGVLSAWGAIVAVYLGIAALTPGRIRGDA